MKKRFERNEIVARLRDTIATGKPIIGAGCSAGLIARAAELGGADVIICYSTGQSRIRGLQTVNIDHANPQTLSMYDEISNVVRDTPIIAGVEACDQTVYDLDELCRRFVDQGYDGVINFPGFVGASSIERIPVEKAVMGAVQGFKSHAITQRKGSISEAATT